MFKSIVTSLAIVVGSFAPAHAGNTIGDHRYLMSSLLNSNVNVLINPRECDSEDGFDGAYHSITRTLTVCQDNAKQYNVMVPWTDNDLDTLRHEAHHVVQDCYAGDAFDGRFRTMFQGQEHEDFVSTALSWNEIKGIVKGYAKNGADKEEIMLELEAFSVADSVDASNIAAAVSTVCASR